MFVYIRYFSIISLILVAVAAFLVGVYFKNIAAADLKVTIEQSNVSLAQGFINTTWKKHRAMLQELAGVSVKDWPKQKGFIGFSKDAFLYFEEMPVAKMNVYTAKGKRFLSTNQSKIIYFDEKAQLASKEMRKEDFKAALSGRIRSRILENTGFQMPSGTLQNGTLVQTFIPVISDNYVPVVADSKIEVEGVIEVFQDIGKLWSQIYMFQMVATGGIILIFLFLIVALVYTARKAEGIIAKQHEKNVELAAAKAEAEAENREKSKFLANISHELRTPLNAIIGFSEILDMQMKGQPGFESCEEYVRDIHSSGVHLLSLINDILDYSKASAGKLELEVSDVDATKIIRTSMRLVSPRAEEAGVLLVEELPKDHYVIKTDGKKFKQVLLNLLSNAVKFTPADGSVIVSAWQNVTDGSVTVEVKDTGIGIAPKDISKAMSPFGQVDSELSRKYEGTGLGLPLTKKFVEAMGGAFDIKSELNVGTTITIVLPREAPEQLWKKGSNTNDDDDMADE